MSPPLARPPRGGSRLVLIGSHLGYPMEVTPLGGGAMVGLQLARQWARRRDLALSVIGSGPQAPAPDLDYWSPPAWRRDLVRLSELGYARFCREFERASTDALEARRAEWDPEETCVVVNDISEGPDLDRIASWGYPILSIWHVDVVDFFNRMYARDLVAPHRLTRAYARASALGLGRALPDVLRLVFDKQRRSVLRSGRLVVPSGRMAETIRLCYGNEISLEDRISVIPWGGWLTPSPLTANPPAGGERVGGIDVVSLRSHYQIGPGTMVLMTLSRISPEKGIHLLLEALRLSEEQGGLPEDVCLFICGEPAFMRGRAYDRQVRAAAERLKGVRVFFPGYLSPGEKAAFFAMADLFVSPSIHESYGLTMVEALRGGLPVLASDHAGVDEILEPAFSVVVPYNGEAGAWLGGGAARGGVARRLAAALEELLRDKGRLGAMGKAAARAGEVLSFEAAADRVAEAALTLIGRKKHRIGG